MVQPRPQSPCRRQRNQRRPCVDTGRGTSDCRRGTQPNRHRHRRKQAQQQGQPRLVRPDHLAARGQWPVWFLGQNHALAGAKPVRASQSPDLPAYRFAPFARGLPAYGERHHANAGQEQHGPLGPVCQNRHRAGLYQAQQKGVRQRQGQRPLCHHPHFRSAQRLVRRRAKALRLRGAPLHRRVLSARAVHGHHPHQPSSRCWKNPSFQNHRPRVGRAGLASHLRQRGG